MEMVNNEPNQAIDVLDPPSPDSPSNILNVLNDFCIRSIFGYIQTLPDYLSAAEVCKKFQTNAIACFPMRLQKVYVCDADNIETPNDMAFERVESLMSIFGHLMKSVEWRTTTIDQQSANEFLNMIAHYSGKSLIELVIEKQHLDFNTNQKFAKLEFLEMEDATFYNFQMDLPLRMLKLWNCNQPISLDEWFLHYFPGLQSVHFLKVKNLTSEIANKFLEINAHVSKCEFLFCEKLSTEVFKDIGIRAPNLERITYYKNQASAQFDENMMGLSELKKLKFLSIGAPNVSSEAVFELLTNHDLPVEELELNCQPFDKAPTIKYLKQVTLYDVSDEILINFVKNHPLLDRMRINASEHMTLWGVKKTLELAKNLKVITFAISNLDISLEEYQSLLDAINQRLCVCLTISKGTINVPPHVLASNRKWLNISVYNYMT